MLTVGVAIAVAGSSPESGAHATRPANWRIAATMAHCRPGEDMLSVTATGPRDAWALGSAGIGSACSDLEHWDGRAWRRIAVPRAAGAAGTFSPPVAASSGRDAWIFPALPSARYCSYQYALHWDGRAWHRSDFPAKITVSTAAAFGPKDVWAFGQTIKQTDLLIRYAVRRPCLAPGRPRRHSRSARLSA